PYPARGYPLVLPSCGRLQDRLLQHVRHTAQGAGRTADMRLKAQTTEKLADRFGPNAALEAEGIERRHHQADEPTAACLRFPPPGLRVLIAALHRLLETMTPALGEPGLMGNLADALLGVVTKSVENPKTFGPQSHVGLSSEGKLNSWWNSAPQRTGPTPHCPALGDFPRLLIRESQVQPLLLVVEDLHWVDAETQALLDSLVESLPTSRLLLLVNYRPEYQHG